MTGRPARAQSRGPQRPFFGAGGPELEPKPAALLGQRVSFTGRLATLSRPQAARLVARAAGRLAATVTPAVTMVVVGMRGWPLLESGRLTRKLAEAERLRDAGRPIRILSEDAFREHLGLAPSSDVASKSLEASQVGAALGVAPAVLERWEHLGLVRPREGRFDFRDLVSLRTVTELVSRGVSPVVIRRSLEGLHGLLPGIDRPLAQLKILISDSGRLVAELEDALLSPCGQLELRFGQKEAPRQTSPLLVELARAEPHDAAWWLECGLGHESAGRTAEAERAYRRAASLDPASAGPHFNLGNVLLATGRLDAAVERFTQALSVDPVHSRAWYNLAHAQDEQGRAAAALKSLRRAVAADPSFADAHFNLADLAERLGQPQSAQRAWREYLRLDPAGEWAAEARRRLHHTRRPAWA